MQRKNAIKQQPQSQYSIPASSPAQEERLKDSLYRLLTLPYRYPYHFFVGLLLLAYGASVVSRFNQPSESSKSIPGSNSLKLIKGRLEGAQRLLIGESHKQRAEVNQFLNQYTADITADYAVYLEMIPSGKEVECAKHEIDNKPNRKCVGWDDSATVSVERDLEVRIGSYSEALHIVKRLHKNMSTKALDENLVQDIPKLELDIANSLVENGFTSFDQIPKNYGAVEAKISRDYYLCEQFKKIVSLRNEGMSYEDIFESEKEVMAVKRHTYNDVLPERIKDTFLKRNQSLMSTLNEHEGLFAVVIAGYDHVTPRDKRYKDAQKQRVAAQYVQDELEKSKDQNPYAILAMKPK